MKTIETVGKPVSMFGEPIPVGNYHFSTKNSRHRPEGEEPKYVGILRTLDKRRSIGSHQFWWYWIATFAPKNVKGTAINTCVPYYNDEEAAIRAWRDVYDRYYPENKDSEFGCRDWSEVCENTERATVTLSESQLHNLIAESVKKVLKEMETPTPYGPMTSGEWKPTFDDPKQQEEFSSDVIDMLSEIPDERFVNLYWNRRLTFDDPNTVDAIYKEAIKRGLFDNPAL